MKHYPKIFEIFPIISFPFDGLRLRRVSGSVRVRVRVRVAAGSGSAPQGLLPRREALPGWRQGGGKFFRELDVTSSPPNLYEPSCCIKVWLNQLHTTIKRRFPLL